MNLSAGTASGEPLLLRSSWWLPRGNAVMALANPSPDFSRGVVNLGIHV